MLMKDPGWFYQVDSLRVIEFLTLRVKVMERVVLWEIQKELGLAIK